MKSKWFVEECYYHGVSGSRKRYQVVRLIDPAKPDSYENRELAKNWLHIKKREANAEAKRLNSEDTQ